MSGERPDVTVDWDIPYHWSEMNLSPDRTWLSWVILVERNFQTWTYSAYLNTW